jgi:fructose-bisphosphate aldolase class I
MTTTSNVAETARALVTPGKGLLAADETVSTVTRRLDLFDIESSAESRRAYREMFFSTPGISQFISGVIMQDETIHQTTATGKPLVDLLARQGILPGIKVDDGAKRLAGCPGETVTEGLDGLRQRLNTYKELGARFAKWRAVIAIGDTLPTDMCISANAHALARYAALCQEQGLVPIVEPEVLMEGAHSIERCEEVTGAVLHAVFEALHDQRVSLEGMLLKPNMVMPGSDHRAQASVDDVASATVRCLSHHAPAAIPGIVFLSGGQDHILATMHLSAINQLKVPKPWALTFSYGRALQEEALEAWGGKSENVDAGQRAFYHRAKCESAAALGRYTSAMESESRRGVTAGS